MTDAVPLYYYGGKRRLADWIASMLPWDFGSHYIEPYAGMASVLLARAAVKLETLNDLNGRVINWWRTIRDEPDAFARLLAHTPHSRQEFEDSIRALDDMSLPSIRRALAFHVVIAQCVHSGDNATPANWRRRFTISSNSDTMNTWRAERVDALAERLHGVQLENRDALDILERAADVAESVIYVDPPYSTATTSPYTHDAGTDGLVERLHAQTGHVAVSGYGAEWDALDWVRHEQPSRRHQIGGAVEDRTEVLWTNYQPPHRMF